MSAPQTSALPRGLLHVANRVAARRARRDLDAVWRRHQAAVHAEMLDLLLAGRQADDIVRELQQEREAA